MVIAHRGQGHDAPPKTIEEGPSSPAEPLQGVLFGEVDETRKREHGDADQEHQQSEFFVGLGERNDYFVLD